MLINTETQWPRRKDTHLCHTYKCWNTVVKLCRPSPPPPRYVRQVMRNVTWSWYVRFCGNANMAPSVFAEESAASISSRPTGLNLAAVSQVRAWGWIQLTCGWRRSPRTGVVKRWTPWHSKLWKIWFIVMARSYSKKDFCYVTNRQTQQCENVGKTLAIRPPESSAWTGINILKCHLKR